MPPPYGTSPQYIWHHKKVLAAVNERIRQLNSILQYGNRVLKEARSKSQYSAFSIQRFVGSALNRFFANKFEILSNAKIRLKRSKRCHECVRTGNCLEEVNVLLVSPSMTFDKLQSDMKAILEKVVMVPNYEVESNSDAVINEFNECITKTKEESRELEAAMKLSKEASAKLKDQLNKAFADGYYGDESSVPALQIPAKQILEKHYAFIEMHIHHFELAEEIGKHEAIIAEGCVDCLAAQVDEFEQMIERFRDSLERRHHFERTDITQEMVDKEKATCPVCLDNLPVGFTSAFTCPGCHHVFDKNCISTWLKKQTVCPHCRFKLRAPYMAQ